MNFEFITLPEMETAMAYGSPKGPTLEDLRSAYCMHNSIDSVKNYFTTLSITKNKITETLFVLYSLMEPNHLLPKDFQRLIIKPSDYVKFEIAKEGFEEAIQSNMKDVDAYVKSQGKKITMTNILFLCEEVTDHINVYFPVK
jgi:hypothetical protein